MFFYGKRLRKCMIMIVLRAKDIWLNVDYMFSNMLAWIIHPEQRARQAKLGCAPAQALLDIGKVIDIQKNIKEMEKDSVKTPRRFEHYKVDCEQG